MTHEGRMARGEEKISKGITDIETEYYLANKVEEKPIEKPKKTKEAKDAKPTK